MFIFDSKLSSYSRVFWISLYNKLVCLEIEILLMDHPAYLDYESLNNEYCIEHAGL